jgi:hypothetical protein
MRHSKLRTALLAATLLAAGGIGLAAAQSGASVYDASQLPSIQGKVAQYDLTPRGDVDGLILEDGTEVHFPPHLGTEIVAVVKPGDAVTVHGLKARALPLVQAMSVTADASGKTVQDTGPAGGPPGEPMGGPRGPGPHHGRPPGPAMMGGGQPMTAQGTVKTQLHGPRGELNGVLLNDGTIVKLPPPEATRLADQIKTGQTVYVQGDGFKNNLGTIVLARGIGPSADKLTEIKMPMPPWHRGPGGERGGPDAPPPPPPPG